MGKAADAAWENGRVIGELGKSLTAQQFVDLFWSPKTKPTLDPVSAIARLNARRASKGEQPAWPSWLMRSVPRAS